MLLSSRLRILADMESVQHHTRDGNCKKRKKIGRGNKKLSECRCRSIISHPLPITFLSASQHNSLSPKRTLLFSGDPPPPHGRREHGRQRGCVCGLGGLGPCKPPRFGPFAPEAFFNKVSSRISWGVRTLFPQVTRFGLPASSGLLCVARKKTRRENLPTTRGRG